MNKRQNIFVAFLELLEVKHTKEFSNKYFNEHPHKYNLYGLSKMLTDYGIENIATRIANKEEDIKKIQTPFIAHFGGDFAVVSKVTSDEASFFWRGHHHVLPIPKFLEAWNGIILLAESSSKSAEPDYKEHTKIEWLNILKKGLLFSACGFILLLTYLNQSLYTNVGISLLLFVNLIGVFIGWLLLLKHLHIQSQYVDKICSLFKQSDCNSALESNATKLFGVIGLSEVGLGYFLSNSIVLLFTPALVVYVALINIFTLPFTFWSVWFQHSKAKQWCTLCLIVLGLLWTIFIVNLLFGYIRIPGFGFQELLTLMMVGSGYIASILGIHILAPKASTDRTVQAFRQTINSIKADEDVFAALLKKQPFYDTDCDSIIRFGNPNSPLQLTILTNPYCNPCSRMHKRIDGLLHKMGNNIGVQYFLSSFREELNITNNYLIAMCLKNEKAAIKIFNDWFEKGKALRDEYFKDMNLDMDNPEIEMEFQKHESWRKRSQIRATPTVLVNGYQLPESYKIEDLEFVVNDS